MRVILFKNWKHVFKHMYHLFKNWKCVACILSFDFMYLMKFGITILSLFNSLKSRSPFSFKVNIVCGQLTTVHKKRHLDKVSSLFSIYSLLICNSLFKICRPNVSPLVSELFFLFFIFYFFYLLPLKMYWTNLYKFVILVKNPIFQ